jgi:hypothetical protein
MYMIYVDKELLAVEVSFPITFEQFQLTKFTVLLLKIKFAIRKEWDLSCVAERESQGPASFCSEAGAATRPWLRLFRPQQWCSL